MYGYNLGLAKARVSESVPAAPANVVQPLLVGNGAVGSVVTCNPGAWSGSPSPTFVYDFRIDGSSVQSGASNTYTPLIGDDTKTLTCLVTATNTEGSASEGTSNSLVIGTAPSNTVAPVISGTNTFGSTLTTTDGTFTGTAPLTYTYQWRRNGSPISGQTASTYVIGSSDSLAAITCEVKATNSYGFDSEVSDTITVVDFAPVNQVAPTVSPSGTQSTGTLITADVESWDGVAPITYEYKWTRDGIAISGATASTYTIQLADDGTTIRVEVKGTNAYGTSAFIASSNSVSAVNTVAPTISSATISGTAVVGQTLTASASGVTGIPTPTLSYQWLRGATNIGTNADTYTLVQADAGNTSNITCVVTATNAAGSANATSNQIAQILTVRTSGYVILNSISDATLRNAINNVDIGVINNSLTNLRAFYFFNTGTADKAKYNFFDQQDTDAAFRMTFVNTVSGDFTSNGWLPNGTNSYGNSHFTPSVNASVNGVGHGIYSRTNSVIGIRVYGCATTAATAFLQNNTVSGTFISGSVANNTISYTPSPTTRFLYNRRNSSTDMQAYRDGTSLGTNTNACTLLPNSKFFFGARNSGSGTPDFFSNLQITVGVLDIGLTNAQASTLRTIIDNYNLECGINI
jgi:hypothetical protein